MCWIWWVGITQILRIFVDLVEQHWPYIVEIWMIDDRHFSRNISGLVELKMAQVAMNRVFGDVSFDGNTLDLDVSILVHDDAIWMIDEMNINGYLH